MTTSTDPAEQFRREYLDQVRNIIRRYGYAVQCVMGVENGPRSFAYTVGLTACSRPEFAVSGTSPEHSQWLLNSIARKVIAGAVYRNGDRPKGIQKPHPPCLLQIPDEYLVIARQIYDRPISALQLALPDRRGRYPWDDGCTQYQDLLGLMV